MSQSPTGLDVFPASSSLDQASKFDNMHVLLWLIKDTCWLLEWRVFGTLMIAPTLAVAVLLAVRSRADRIFFINVAICFWITANSYWMLCEFFQHEEIKYYAGIPFAFGFIAVATFYLKPHRETP
jgi:hypothetical protein